ncbi:alkaline phosphatase [Vibrio comitans]|uniref:Alkaline phosphatase n=1 Tax=Vibrio comitans NBRC 102076 TaxID=1219078 RepID=A0A4Y3IMR4_9VIBR|nr:alkaline phosphatase [Vibrio comitans]GEA60789.1 alkaline phosphatase [Vibrio comitans NBRC 102076]
MLKIKGLTLSISLALAATTVSASLLPDNQVNSDWYQSAEQQLDQQLVQSPTYAAKNVVVFFANGMGPTTLTAARIHEGQLRGDHGEENILSFERFSDTGLLKTYNTNQQIADTAASMTAMTTGVKTKAGVMGLTDNVERGDCDIDNEQLHTLIELATHKGMATGLVSTGRVTHASAAPLYAHTSNRDWESAVSGECNGKVSDIAYQLVHEAAPINVVLGGGSREFLPKPQGGVRANTDLTKDWVERFGEDAAYIDSKQAFLDTDFSNSDRILGLFNESHLNYEFDKDTSLEPTLSEMTEAALELLANNERSQDNGFLLSVSASRIAHGHQTGTAARALTETIALGDAVQSTITYLSDHGILEDTLVVVAADHSYTLSFAGYPQRGNPILGISESYDGQGLDGIVDTIDGPGYTTLGYANGPGAFVSRDENGDRLNPEFSDTEALDYQQQATVPLQESTSAGEDVPVFATGPRSYLVRGTSEQQSIFHAINQAAELGAQQYRSN